MNDWKQIRNWSREEMLRRVARFSKLKGSDGGLPDSPLPECRRTLYAVIGFQPPAAAGDAGDPDRRGLQPRLLQGQTRQGPADAQPRHERDLHRDHRALALRVERRRRDGARRPRAARRDLAAGGRGAALHERDLRRAAPRAHPDVRHRRRPAAGRVHAARDAALRRLAAARKRFFSRTNETKSVASRIAIPATDFHSGEGWACA